MVIGTREAILQRIGHAIHERRLRKNITQRTLAERSGISMTAVKHLERGVGATLGSFVQVCRTLNMDGWIEENGAWELAPAYDLTGCHFSADDHAFDSWMNQHALSVNGRVSAIDDDDLLAVAEKFGIGTASRLLKEVKQAV